MKAHELRAMTAGELEGELDGLQQEYFNLRFQFSSGQLRDTSRLRLVRRDIARVKTILREKEWLQIVEEELA